MAYVPQRPLRGAIKCPFCAKSPDVQRLKSGYFWGTCSRCRWTTKLFESVDDVVLYLRSDFVPLEGTTVRKLTQVGLGGEAFIIVGVGWQSRPFQTERQALYWQNHSWGRPTTAAEAYRPDTVFVKEREPPHEDPVSDLRSLQQHSLDEALDAQPPKKRRGRPPKKSLEAGEAAPKKKKPRGWQVARARELEKQAEALKVSKLPGVLGTVDDVLKSLETLE
jgi:hypothetical protein